MEQMQRYAVYFAPREGGFADRAAEWLGWDALAGAPVPQPELPGIPFPAILTAEARRYGFHGTIRAPFRLADGISPEATARAVAGLAGRVPAVTCGGLVLENLQGFVALTPLGCEAGILELAAAVVEGTNALRAPLTGHEIARRRPESLTPRQRELLGVWGYPYVMDEFRFHLTLTDRLPEDEVGPVMAALSAHFAPVLPRPFVIEDLCLFGEDAQGRFHLLHRYALAG
jgi:Protein of unknown function (DUF1045)